MSNEYDNAAFIARLPLGDSLSRDINIQLNEQRNENLLRDGIDV